MSINVFTECHDCQEAFPKQKTFAKCWSGCNSMPPPILFRAIRDEWVFTTTEICFIQELLGAFEGLYGVFLRK